MPPATPPKSPTWGPGVAALRLACNLTQSELAARAGVTQSVISGIEAGKRSGTDATRIRIARALGVDPHQLFPYRDEVAS